MAKDLFAQMLGGSSVGLSVGHGGVTDGLTDGFRGGGVGRWMVATEAGLGFTAAGQRLAGAALGQVVDVAPREVRAVAEFGRVCVVAVIPERRVDPVLPLLIGGVSGAYVWHYRWHYRRYYRALVDWLAGDVLAGWRLRRLERRLALAARGLVSEREWLVFTDYLAHGRLGEARWGIGR